MELDSVPSEDEIGGYIPLERPSCSNANITQAPPRQQIVYSDEESNHDSSSDDSDDARIVRNSLKRKIPCKTSVTTSDITKKKKFSVWSDILQEDAMENQFNDSKFFGGCRGNETYNYRMKYFEKGNENDVEDSQMNEDSKNNDKPGMKNRPWAKRRKFNRKLKLGSLDVTVEDSEGSIALDIAKKLNEPKTELIEKIVNTLGKQKAIEMFNKTREIEQKGGYLTLDKTRRRTSGGVFLKLVKGNKLSKKQFDAIFKYNDDFGQKHKSYQKKDKETGEEKKSWKDDDFKDLPTRGELELSSSIEDSETSVLKNPPPSPVHPSSLPENSCSLSDLFPNSSTGWPQQPFNTDEWPTKCSFNSDSLQNTSVTTESITYTPTSPSYEPLKG